MTRHVEVDISGDRKVTLCPGDKIDLGGDDLLVYLTGKEARLWKLLCEIRSDETNRALRFVKGKP